MRRLDRGSEAELPVGIDAMATTHLRPKLIFMRCLDLLRSGTSSSRARTV